MKNLLSAITATLAVSISASAAPRLVVSTPSLVPESQIDIVLDSPAVAATELGKTVENKWVEVQPAMPGKLFWKAPNIAQLIPDSAPVIGANYTFSISGNHAYLDGSAVPAGKFATLASEPFRVMASNAPNRWSSDYSPSTGEWLIVFNDAVDPAVAANFISFSSKSGLRVAARVEHPTYERAGYYASNYKPWTDRFPGTKAGEPAPDSPVPFILSVTPATPLPAADGWVLSVFKGLPNRSTTAQVSELGSYDVGDIKPFQVANINAYVTADEPRQIVIEFNHPVSEFLPVDFLTKCLDITPRPENLSARFEGRELYLSGNLADAEKYTVTMRPPFTSKAGLDLASPSTKEITFEHLDPELVLPSNNEAQLANGSRIYRVQTINITSLHVRIKKLAGTDLVRAYQGYRQYTGSGHDGETVQPTSPLPYSLVAGETIFDKEIALENPVDTSKEITLRWDEILPANLKNAALFIDITGTPNKDSGKEGRRNAQALLQLTDIGLAWKLTSKDAFIYAFSCDTGVPLPGVKLELFGEDAAALHSATTDASGLASVPRPDTARHLHATLGADSYLTAFDSTMDTVGLWHFPIRYSWNEPVESSRKAFLFTDRSLYRPGEKVRMKGIVRSLRGNTVEAAKASPARIVIIDPAENEIHSSPVTISESGSFDFTFTLPAGKTGTHMIRLEYPEELAQAEALEDDWEKQEALNESGRFEIPLRVEEFRRNSFEVLQSVAAPATGATTLSADLSATYYQGQPVAAGKVKYFSRVTARNPYPERFRDYLFGNHRTDDWTYWYHYFGYRSDDEEDSGSQVSQNQGEAVLSADGKATLPVEIPQAKFPTTREVAISSEVTDANNQTLTSTSTTSVHPASVYIGISRNDSLVRAGDALPLKIVATDTNGEPFPGAVKVTATLTREVNSTVKSRTDSGATTTRNDVAEETVSTTELTLDPAKSAGQGNDFIVTPKSTGRHFLTVRGTDPDGRAFATVTYFNAYGTNEYPWLYEDGMRVKLVAEKKSYKPGETARVLVLSPIEGTALVTVEREKVLRSFQVQLKADKPVVEIPLSADDAPNAYVSILIIKGAKESARDHKEPQLRLGYCELIVENLRDQLAVSLETPSSCRPGDEITLIGAVTLADGKPAAGAEVTLYAEDEGTLAVMGYETPRPMDYFYKPRNLDVKAGTSFETFISEDPEMQDFSNKGFFIGGGGDLSKLADLMRKNFDPCATWAPALVADASGKFSHTFKVPDTLTRYRLIAVAHHDAARFGQAESAIVVKKDLMLEPKAPRFANQMDTFTPQVLVQNASTHSGTWEIKYNTTTSKETPCVVAVGSTTEKITLAAGASTTVIFPSRDDNTGEAVLQFQATPVSLKNENLTPELTRALSDAVETRFQVEYPMPLLRQTKLVSLGKSGAKLNLLGQLDPRLLEGSGDIDLAFARSPLVEAAGSIDFLLHYPYGCVEQTTSSLIPWLTVESLSSVIPSFASISEEKVTTAIQAGADRLLSMQLPDGSFAYWPGGTESVPWATSYAGLGLMMAAEKGANVPPSALESLTKNLIESLHGLDQEKSASALEIHARSLFVLALAGSPQPAYQNVLVDRIAELTPGARCLLASAIAMEDEGNEANLARAKSVLTSKTPFKSRNDNWMPWSADEAYNLIAWQLVDPEGTEATKVLDRMLRDRNPYGHWRTTWVNGWSLMALAQYAEKHDVNGESINLAFETSSGKQAILLTEDQPAASRSFRLTPDLKLSVSADREAFVRINVAAKPKVTPTQPVATNGLSIDRIYERVNADGTTTILADPQIGDLIRVSLRVTLPKDDTRYLVIEDPLPCVFETVNTDFKSQRAAIGVSTSENDWNVSHSELRSNRASFFLDEVWRKGTYTVTYLARCTLAGQATAPPAKVESMYDPENFALSASRVFTTK
ncbi:MAG: MG2 domain-containing protein [Luteolibacter sp.]|uniref:alpha-2-macroglobulin family protein n=1 Tax=Luteolibacter sp. TaxID=1962973 RepID=UPI0032661075